MRRLILWVFVYCISQQAYADTWVLSSEANNIQDEKQCLLRSPIVNNIEIHFDGSFSIVAKEMLDDLPDMMGLRVDQRDLIVARYRGVSPYTIYMSDAVADSTLRTKNIIAQFINGRSVAVSVETILNGRQTAEITLIGFTRAYELYTSCKR